MLELDDNSKRILDMYQGSSREHCLLVGLRQYTNVRQLKLVVAKVLMVSKKLCSDMDINI